MSFHSICYDQYRRTLRWGFSNDMLVGRILCLLQLILYLIYKLLILFKKKKKSGV